MLAKSIDTAARSLRAKYESTVEEPERQAYATLAKARFAVYGKALAPDATAEVDELLDNVQSVIAKCASVMPTHADYVAQHCAMARG